jgi:hypothetical protein
LERGQAARVPSRNKLVYLEQIKFVYTGQYRRREPMFEAKIFVFGLTERTIKFLDRSLTQNVTFLISYGNSHSSTPPNELT